MNKKGQNSAFSSNKVSIIMLNLVLFFNLLCIDRFQMLKNNEYIIMD